MLELGFGNVTDYDALVVDLANGLSEPERLRPLPADRPWSCRSLRTALSIVWSDDPFANASTSVALARPHMTTKDDRYAALTAELVAERARTLGRAGERLERAIGALDMKDEDADSDAIWDAADAAFCYIVQREVMGLRDSESALSFYRVPIAVRQRIGARRPQRGASSSR